MIVSADRATVDGILLLLFLLLTEFTSKDGASCVHIHMEATGISEVIRLFLCFYDLYCLWL